MMMLTRIVCLFLLLMAAPVGAQDVFVDGLPDVPIMAGLSEDTQARLEFDKEEGRIVEVVLRGTVSPADVMSFYRSSLPALGWVIEQAEDDRLRLNRGRENLTVHADRHGRVAIVTLSLSPR